MKPTDPGSREISTSETLSIGSAGSGAGAVCTASSGALEPGTRVGRFVVVGTAGCGGMGVVYAAYDPELDRKIALKLLRVEATGSTSASQGRLRLQREAQAMARLSHPNVATVHDVGVFDDQVFLAMEFVEGQTVKEWLEAKPRSCREVLEVFKHAGEGLAAAHAAGIIHRDFKPSNVLIGRDGRVRVMDFGLARAAKEVEAASEAPPLTARNASEVPLSLDTPLTRLGTLVGTPGYMAPEQYSGKPVDARTDQYGFCVALYEALYGVRPFKGDTIDELIANVMAGRAREATKDNKIPAWVRRVVLRGLAVDSGQRYPDMQRLIEALEKDPAVARRKQSLAAASLLMVVALALGARAWMKRQSLLCKGAERNLVGVWDVGKKTAVQAAFTATGKSHATDTWTRVARVLDSYTTQWVAMHAEACEATQVRGEQSPALLDLRMGCLEGRLKDVRALVNVFAQADATVVEKAAQAAHSLPQLSRCADKEALTAAIAPPEDKATQAKVEALRDQLIEARAVEQAGKYAAGLELATTAAGLASQIDYPPVTAEALHRLGSLQEKTGAYEAAQQTLRRAWLAAETAGHDEVEAEATTDLAFVVGYDLGRLAEGEQLGELAGAIVKRLHRGRDLEAKWLARMGTIFWFKGEYGKAQEHFERSLRIREKTLGPKHPDVAMSLNNLGAVVTDMGRYDQAQQHLSRALAIWQETLGPEHPDVAKSLNNLANVFHAQGDFRQAQTYHERALVLREKALGPTHGDVAMSLNNLGEALEKSGDYARAQACHERALAIWEAALGPGHPDVAWSLNNLGDVFKSEGEYDRAQRSYARALAIREKGLGPEHPLVAGSLSGLADVLAARGDDDRAGRYYKRALAICAAKSCEPDVVPEAAFGMAKLLAKTGSDHGRAGALAEQARAAYSKMHTKKNELAQVETWLMQHPR